MVQLVDSIAMTDPHCSTARRAAAQWEHGSRDAAPCWTCANPHGAQQLLGVVVRSYHRTSFPMSPAGAAARLCVPLPQVIGLDHPTVPTHSYGACDNNMKVGDDAATPAIQHVGKRNSF